MLESDRNFKFIITVNSEITVCANENDRLRNIIDRNIGTLDGQIPFLFARLRYPGKKIEKISGSDLIYILSGFASDNKMRIFLLGGYPDSNKKSVEVLRTRYGIEIDGYSPPHQPFPFDNESDKIIMEKISDFRPHILFVAFGAPKQEFWIEDHQDQLISAGVQWAVGCGGTFEMVSGKYKRAPKIIQRFALEGLHRLIQEPRWFRVKRIIRSLKIFKYILLQEK